MILQLKRIFEREGEQTVLNSLIPLEELGDAGRSLEFTAPVSLSGRIQNIAGMVSLDYTVRTKILLVCDRCLDEFTKDIDLSFSHILVDNEDKLSGDDDIYCEEFNLDMTELVVSDLLISFPTKILCSEGCLGLCPVCGKNLNHGECMCDKESE